MISVTNATLEVLKEDETALEACLQGLLNYSAYAEKIRTQIEEKTFKTVKKGTIVAALSRINRGKLKDLPSFKPNIQIHNLSIKSPLDTMVYSKTADVQRRVATLNPFLVSPNDIFAVTEATTEILISCSETSKVFIKNHIGIIPKKEFENVAAITAQFSEELSNIPNFLHVLFTALAHKRINLLYVVSGYTEVTFLVDKENMEETIKILDTYTPKKKQV